MIHSISRVTASIAVAMLCLLAATDGLAAEKPAREGHRQSVARNKIVIQISDNDPHKWNSILGNVRNVQAELGQNNVQITVVAFGAGLGMLTLDSPVGSDVTDAMKTGIRFVACENTMKGQHLTKDDMLPDLHYAPAAIVEIMKLQQQGYAYVKP